MMRGPAPQVRPRCLAHPEHGVEVGAQHPVHLVGIETVEAFGTARPVVAGVVDQDVQAAEPADGVVDDLFARLARPEVAGDEHGSPPGRLDQGLGRVGVGLFVGQVVDGDVGALAGVGDRDGAADPGVATGDQRPHPSGGR